VASEGPYLAALKVDLTPELIREGLAREFIRRVQDLRKQAGLEISDRIRLYASASPVLAEAIQEHRVFIQGETLATELYAAEPPLQATKITAEFEGEKVDIGII
jgi:isoleucyl-tRNA synthetase